MSLSVRPGGQVGLGNLTREIAQGGIAGILTGLLVGGVGGRIVMRISSLIDPSARRFRTEGGATVGEFTLGGTLELFIFVGLFSGIFLAVVWVIVRPWLPRWGRARYGAAGIVAVAVGARLAVEGRNRDFVILDPPAAQAALFIVLAALAGFVVVALDGWLDRKLPPSRVLGPVYTVLSLVGALLTVPSLLAFFDPDACSCASPPRLVGALLIGLGAATAAVWVVRIRGSEVPPQLARAGLLLVVAVTVSGLAHLFGEIAHFV